MANINLISAQRAETIRLRRATRALMFTVFATLGCVVAVLGWCGAQTLATQARLGQVERELVVLRPKLNAIREMEARRQALRPRLTTLQEARESTTRWFAILEGLRRSVTEQLWLTGLAVERGSDDGVRLRLNGVALSNTAVGEAMRRLNVHLRPNLAENQYFELRYSQPAAIGRTEAVEFEVAASLTTPKREVSHAVSTK